MDIFKFCIYNFNDWYNVLSFDCNFWIYYCNLLFYAISYPFYFSNFADFSTTSLYNGYFFLYLTIVSSKTYTFCLSYYNFVSFCLIFYYNLLMMTILFISSDINAWFEALVILFSFKLVSYRLISYNYTYKLCIWSLYDL